MADEIAEHVRVLCEGDDASKAAAAKALGSLAYFPAANKVAIVEAGGISPLVDLLRDGGAEAKGRAARALNNLASNHPTGYRVLTALEGLIHVLREGDDASKTVAAKQLGDFAIITEHRRAIAAAGGISPLVDLLRDGGAEAKGRAAEALFWLAFDDANRILISEAGAVPRLVDLLRDGREVDKGQAAMALGNLARKNDANAVAIAAEIGFDAVVELARDGRVHVPGARGVPPRASCDAKRKAARLLPRMCLPRAIIPDEIAAATALFLV